MLRDIESRRWRSISGLLFLAPLIALWAIPVVIFVVLVPEAQGQEANALQPGVVRTVTVGSRLDAATQAVDVSVTSPPAAEVKSATSGLVTSVSAVAGRTLINGDLLFTVDGAGVLAYAAPSPLYRDLAPGAKGSDVHELAQYLSAIGLLPPGSVSASYGRSIAAAVSKLETRIAVTADGNFRTGFVAWVPPATTAIGEVVARVGDHVNPGDVLVRGSAAPTRVSFTTTGSTNARPVVPPGTVRLRSGDAHIDFGSLALGAAEKATLQSFLVEGVAIGGISVTTPPGSAATIYSGAVLSAAKPQKVAVVPSSSLYATNSGRTCVFTVSRNEYRAVGLTHPELISGELGSVSVPAELVGRTVVRDPSELSTKTRTSCG
jgi:hypothetical protein